MPTNAQAMMLAEARAGGGASWATLDGTASNATLSNGNLTASHSNTSYGGARSNSVKTSGKYYFEATLIKTTGDTTAVGLIIPSGSYSDVSSGLNVACIYRFFNGYVFSNGGALNDNVGGTFVDGEVLGVAADVDNKAFYIYRGSDSSWHPAAPGGTAYSMSSFSSFAPFVAFDGDATEAVTMNFGASSFAHAVPSGYTAGWPA